MKRSFLVKNVAKQWIYLGLFVICILVTLLTTYVLFELQQIGLIPNFIKPLIEGFGGNLTSGIVGGVIFLPLVLFLDAQTEKNIRYITQTTERRELLRDNERKISHFEDFMSKESYHNARFPDLKEEAEVFGLEYLIRPVREPQTGKPHKKISEMDSLFVIKVDQPANLDVLDSEQLAKYDSSPIHEDEYYFCRFFNNDWHMTTGEGFGEWHRFYLSSKEGPVEYGISANEFMELVDDSFKDMKLIETLYLGEDGMIVREGGCTPYHVYLSPDGNVFLRIWKSRPKRIFHTNQAHTTGSDWILVIDNIRGNASGKKLENIISIVIHTLKKHDLTPKKIAWYDLPTGKQLQK